MADESNSLGQVCPFDSSNTLLCRAKATVCSCLSDPCLGEAVVEVKFLSLGSRWVSFFSVSGFYQGLWTTTWMMNHVDRHTQSQIILNMFETGNLTD